MVSRTKQDKQDQSIKRAMQAARDAGTPVTALEIDIEGNVTVLVERKANQAEAK